MPIKYIFKLLKELCYKRQRLRFYIYPTRQGNGRIYNDIKVYSSYAEIPMHFRKIVLPSPMIHVMFYRLMHNKVKLICYSENGQQLDGYGWIQDWQAFQYRFGTIANWATMLGYYWITPEARGRGYYSRLLEHSIAISSKEFPILIYTSKDNELSQKSIEKVGFILLGEWEIYLWFRVFVHLRKITV